MYLVTNSTDGHILHAQPGQPTAGSGQTVVQVEDTATHATMCLNDPTAYWWNGTAIVPWPALSVASSSSTSSGTTTVTDTISFTYVETPPSGWSYPAHVDVAVGSSTTSLTLSSSHTASYAYTVHESLQQVAVPITYTASNTVGSTIMTASGDALTVGVQAIASSSSTPVLIAPAGEGSLAYLRAFYLGLTPQTQIAVLTESLQNLMVTVSITNRLLTEKILPMLQASSYSPLSLTSAESTAISNWTSNVQGHLVAWADLLDSSGNPIFPYKELQTQAPQALTAMQAYAQAASTLPNLA